MAKTTKRDSKGKARSKHALKDLPASGGQPVKGGGLATVLTNLANLRHESLKAVATNLRA